MWRGWVQHGGLSWPETQSDKKQDTGCLNAWYEPEGTYLFTSHVRKKASQIGCKCWKSVSTIIFNLPLAVAASTIYHLVEIRSKKLFFYWDIKVKLHKKKKPWKTQTAPLKRKDRMAQLHFIFPAASSIDEISWCRKWWEKILHKDFYQMKSISDFAIA